jgi:hypothetical protein
MRSNVLTASRLAAGVLLVFLSAGACDEPRRPAPAKPPGGAQPVPVERREPVTAPPGVARPGKPPERPPPVVPPEVMGKAQALATEAANHLNEAKRAKQVADQGKFKVEITACWDRIHEAFELVSPLREWEEEADLEGWAIPPEAAAQMKTFERWTKTKTECHKIKPR